MALTRRPAPSGARLVEPVDPPVLDADGRARSILTAELTLSPAQVAASWSPAGLERLAGAYWRFLARITLGVIRVRHHGGALQLMLLGRPLVLLSFDPPAYALDGDDGSVGWPITGGLLLSRDGRGVPGVLRISVRRESPSRVRAEVAVTDFAPAIARVFGRRVYEATQARIHVFVTRAFLRWLPRLYREMNCPTAGESAGPS